MTIGVVGEGMDIFFVVKQSTESLSICQKHYELTVFVYTTTTSDIEAFCAECLHPYFLLMIPLLRAMGFLEPFLKKIV